MEKEQVIYPLRMDKSQMQKVAALAKKSDRTRAGVIRLAIKQFLKGKEGK